MKDNHYKIVATLLLVALIAASAYIIKLQWEAKKRQENIDKQLIEMERLQNQVVRSQSQYITSEQFDHLAQGLGFNLEQIQDDLDHFGADIQGLNRLVASSQGKRVIRVPSNNTTPRPDPGVAPLPTCPDGTTCPNVDPYGYLSNSQHLFLSEPFGNKELPIGTVTFQAWEDRPWSYNVFPRNYKLSTVLGQDENGRHYVYNQFRIESNGEEIEVPIKTSEFVEKLPEPKFRFDPHINLGLSVGATIATASLDPDQPRARAEVQPTLDVSLFSYGETKVNPTWKFLGLGIGYETQNNTLGFVVNPADYNLGKHIPLINNFYLGPTVGADLEGQVFVGGGIRVGL